MVALLIVSGCQVIGDIRQRPVAETEQEPTACTFPGAPPEGAERGSLRIGNLVPGAGGVYMCIRSESAAGERPIMLTRGQGAECPGALQYPRLLRPIDVPAGLFEVMVVEEGADCSSAPLATLSGVAVEKDRTTTLVYMSDDAGGGQIRAYLDRAEVSQETGVRFVHAAGGLGLVDVIELGPEWPPVNTRVVALGIAYGGVPEVAEQPTQVIEDGYLVMSRLGSATWFGLGQAGDGTMRYLATGAYRLEIGARFSSFLIGRDGDRQNPVELLRCNDDAVVDEYYTDCSGLGRRDVTFMALHSGLYGSFAMHHRARFAKMLEVLPTLDADVLCMTHVMSDGDKEAIEAALRSGGYEVFYAKQDLETPVDDPTDVNGNVPPESDEAPCALPEVQELADPFLDCLRENADDSGVVQDGRLAVTKCAAPSAPMLFSQDDDVRRCFSCLVYTLTGLTPVDETELLCTTNPKAGLGFQGQSGQLLASRLPMGEPGVYTLPSTAWRANVYRVPVNVSQESLAASWIDVYCAGLNSSVRQEPNEPYTGPYGDGYVEETSENKLYNGWANEAMHQAHKMVGHLASSSEGRPAILLGNFDSGPANEETALEPMAPHLFEYLNSQFGLGVSGDYEWQCLLCGDNPLNEYTKYFTWPEHVFLHNLRPSTVLLTEVVLREAIVPLDASGGLVPLSPHYAIRSTVRISP